MLIAVEKDLRRFMKFVHHEPNSGCWIWAGNRNAREYGWFKYNGRQTKAHRWAARHIGGMAITDLLVCHRCDTPSCVNPEHLFVGTAKDNALDMVRKGRHNSNPNPNQRRARGSARANSKLTEEDIPEIRRLLGEGLSFVKIAKRYGVASSLIGRIKYGKAWAHVK